jgi:hypothetical protein
LEGFQSKLVLKLFWPDFAWLLLAGGHCSEVDVNTGFTVFGQFFSLIFRMISERKIPKIKV